MWIKKMYVVSRFFIGKTPVGILRNDREGDDKGNVKTNKQTNKQQQTKPVSVEQKNKAKTLRVDHTFL